MRMGYGSEEKTRIGILFCFFLSVYVSIIVRLLYVQIVYESFYTSYAERQYYGSVMQCPPRATIFDRNGAYLAMNKESLSAFIIPPLVQEWQQLLSFVKTYFPEQYDRILASKDKKFIYLKRRISVQESEYIKKYAPQDTVRLLCEPGRFYPVSSASSLIGMTDIDNNGIMGMELWLQNIIAGKPTWYELEKDARIDGFCIAKKKTEEGVDACPVTLTIDRDLQFLVHQELEEVVTSFQAKEGAVLVMNPDNGDILAVTCIPQFNANEVSQIDLSKTKLRPFTEAYELGSVIKVCATLAALEEGVVDFDELIDCQNTKTAIIEGRKINTPYANGVIPFWQVIASSNNIGMAIVAKRVGRSLYEHYRRMGFGSKTGISFPGEAAGFVNPPYKWSKQSIISLCYGYEITASLLQLALFFCMIARDGYAVKPRLILSPDKKEKSIDPVRIYSAHAVLKLKKILEQTTLQGTAKRAGIKGYCIMSKTGTANMVVNGSYDVTKNVYTCAGIIQKDSYKRVVVTFIKEANRSDLFASTVAAPLLERIAECLLIHDRIIND